MKQPLWILLFYHEVLSLNYFKALAGMLTFQCNEACYVIVWTESYLAVGLLSHGALGNTVHRQECLEEADDVGLKFLNFLFVVGCWVFWFVYFGRLKCLWQSLGDPPCTHSLSEFSLVAVRQKLQMLPCWSIYTVQLCLKGGRSLVTFYGSPKICCFSGFGNNS